MRLDHPSAHALTASLFDDPFYQALTVDFGSDTQARRAALHQYFAYALLEAGRDELVLADDPTLGAAIWSLPETKSHTGAAEEKLAFIAGVLGSRGFRNYRAMIANMAPLAHDLAGPGAWYLSIIGIAPEQQGTGLGRRLLSATLAQAKEQEKACYLETFSPQTHRFYSAMGFDIAGSAMEPVTGAPYWLMRTRGDSRT